MVPLMRSSFSKHFIKVGVCATGWKTFKKQQHFWGHTDDAGCVWTKAAFVLNCLHSVLLYIFVYMSECKCGCGVFMLLDI